MSQLILPLILLVGTIAGIVIVLHKRAKAYQILEKALAAQGFHPKDETTQPEIDFGVTLQWPEGRGIQYLNAFEKQTSASIFTVAQIRCPEMTGMRMGKLGAAMRTDEIRQSVLSCRMNGYHLPRLCLCPADWTCQFRLLFEGGQEFTSGDPQFDKAFFVVGEKNAQFTSIITASIRQQMLQYPNIMFASGNESILLFEQGVVLPATELGGHLGILESIQNEITTHST